MSRLPLSTLPAFRAVAELQNLRAAAQQLHLSHSAVSQQIRVLEEQLGFLLFDRQGRRVVLNCAGRALLCSVQRALTELDNGVLAAGSFAQGADLHLRVSVLPSFAQRWLLPRMARWRERHPNLTLELETSHQVVDLQREGFHAALRSGRGPWPGVMSEPLFDIPMPLIVLAAPGMVDRLADLKPETLVQQPLLGDKALWQQWFTTAGLDAQVTPVASFNDTGMLLEAAEHGLGLALGRELLAADALRTGRLVKVSPVSIDVELTDTYHLVYPPGLRDWPPLASLRQWIRAELARSHEMLIASQATGSLGTQDESTKHFTSDAGVQRMDTR